MKILIASLAATFGLSWFGLVLRPGGEEACNSASNTCAATVECLPDGTCRIECEGGKTCWMIVDCDHEGECRVVDCGGSDCEGGRENCEVSQGCEVASECAPTDWPVKN